MSSLLQQILSQIDQLTPQEQLQIVGHLMNQLQNRAEITEKSRRSWQGLEGAVPTLLGGEDAQEWVDRLRDEWNKRDLRLRESR